MAVTLERKGFLLLLGIVSVGFAWVVYPLFGAVMWAVCLAILFEPLSRRIAARFKIRPTPLALLTTLLVLMLVIVPGVLTAGFVAQEGSGVLRRVQSGELDVAGYYRRTIEALPRWLDDAVEGSGLKDFPALTEKIKQSAAAGTQPIAAQVWAFGQGTLDLAINFFVMLYLLFFLLRDGRALLLLIRRAVPLDDDVQQRLFGRFATVIASTVKGNVIVAAIQGALGGVALMVLGIPGALLWGVVMAFLSLLPAIGAALVWGPVALYLLATGRVVEGVALIAFGAVIIGLVDNVLRPLLVGKDTQIPDYVVLVTTIGGMSLFGINGFVIGPVIAAMFIAAWEISAEERSRR